MRQKHPHAALGATPKTRPERHPPKQQKMPAPVPLLLYSTPARTNKQHASRPTTEKPNGIVSIVLLTSNWPPLLLSTHLIVLVAQAPAHWLIFLNH